ncbi:serine/threonine protein phosphatase PrpC [Rhodovulum sulfidophilum]|uniref:PP2C family protein-serine/threonine phosphatase n=1 Tax=Rhodovulum sulfidophilum TaxID=35806 RepID=UPI0005AB6587|nr:protein phosphatase 2C domain-containing protein [Rhodovulum sulfidophilum]MCW2304796.1 serine/threonine protein phosphatase PrpC [Rhodovulum sulfidophilum]
MRPEAHWNGWFLLETGMATDVGCRREINEDDMIARPDLGLWAVADGMGGHAAGEFASQAIVTELSEAGLPASAVDLQARFMERLIRANDRIRAHSAELAAGPIGSTVAALLVHEDSYGVVWCGDSRGYLLRDGHLVQQSRDHTELRAALEAGRITPEEARTWPRRNVITRAIGVGPDPECDIVSGRIAPGDLFLLCSDGLTEHLDDTEIADILLDLPPQAACEALIAETVARGARDNVTAVVLACRSGDDDDEKTAPPL